MNDLEILKNARELLVDHFATGSLRKDNNYCAVGAILQSKARLSTNTNTSNYIADILEDEDTQDAITYLDNNNGELIRRLNKAAITIGGIPGMEFDILCSYAIVQLNDNCGKEAVLAAFDLVICELEQENSNSSKQGESRSGNL